MNSDFKPLDRDRKYGIVLFLLTIVSFTVAYNTDGGLQAAFAFVGVASFVTVMVLMGKSVDEHGWGDDPYGEDMASPPDPKPAPDQLRDYRFGPRSGGYVPLDKWRKLGIGSLLLTFVGFGVAANTVGWIQVVSMIVGLLAFMSIFVLMGKSTDEQNAARRK